MTPFPFSYLPNWMNFISIWTGYSVILITTYIILLATLRWWFGDYRDEEVEEWNRMREEARKVREKING